MEIVFVRYGVPDYSLSDERKMSQLEKDYAPLDRNYLDQIYQDEGIGCGSYRRVIL